MGDTTAMRLPSIEEESRIRFVRELLRTIEQHVWPYCLPASLGEDMMRDVIAWDIHRSEMMRQYEQMLRDAINIQIPPVIIIRDSNQ